MTLAAVFFVATGIFVGVREIVNGNVLEGLVAFGFLPLVVVVVVAVQLMSRYPTVLRVSHDHTGTVFRPNRILTMVAFGVLAYFIPFGVAVVALTLTGHLHLFASRHGQAAAVVGMVLVTCTAVTGLVTAWRRGGVGYVKLAPMGVEVADIKNTELVAWDDIVAVDDHSEVNKKTRKAVVLRRRDGTEKTIDGSDFYVPDGVALYWMVRHYWRHDDDRPELVDGRALARLGDGRFDTSVDG